MAKRFKFDNYSQVEFADDVKEFECAACHWTAHKPANLLRGHLFCAGCLSKVDPKNCPTCRASFDPLTLTPNTFAEGLVQQKKVRCANRETDCRWVGELGVQEKNLADHLLVCPERRFSCPRCTKEIRVVDAKQHGDEECQVDGDPKRAKRRAKRKRKDTEAELAEEAAAAAVHVNGGQSMRDA